MNHYKKLMSFVFPIHLMMMGIVNLSDSDVSGVADNPDMIPKIWSPIIYDELRERLAWLNIFSREYEGEIAERGDEVTVNQIIAPVAQTLTNDKVKFATQAMETKSFKVKADRTAIAAFDITSRKKLQSIEFQAKAIEALVYAIQQNLETFMLTLLRSNLVPELDFKITQSADPKLIVRDVTKLRAAMSRIGKVPFGDGNTFMGLDPDSYSDLLTEKLVVGSDFGSVNDLMSGSVNRLAGFGCFEHNGQGEYETFGVHSSAIQLVIQEMVTVKISDQHANQKLGHLVSAHMHYGANMFDNKRYGRLSLDGQTDLAIPSNP